MNMRLPKPKRYLLKYRKNGGEIKTYEISVPIDETIETVTVYSYGGGLRTFKRSNIVDIKSVGASVMKGKV